MDIKPTDQSISDDQELAKVLAGVNAQANSVAVDDSMPAPVSVPDPVVSEPIAPPELTVPEMPQMPEMPVAPEPVQSPSSTSDLDSIKKEALGELRPLVDKLDVAPDEKFDTYLLLLRSTDDSTLIGPAHDAAKAIPDETRRAQALLDVIKEIDYLSNPQQ